MHAYRDTGAWPRRSIATTRCCSANCSTRVARSWRRRGALGVAYSPSAVPNERFHVMPRPLKVRMIRDIVQDTAMPRGACRARDRRRGDRRRPRLLDIAVLESARQPARGCVWRRSRRPLRFLREVIADIRGKVRERLRRGIAHLGHRDGRTGLDRRRRARGDSATRRTASTTCNVTLGNSASLGGAIHIAPPMTSEAPPTWRRMPRISNDA